MAVRCRTDGVLHSDIYRVDEVLARTFNMVLVVVNIEIVLTLMHAVAIRQYGPGFLHSDPHKRLNTGLYRSHPSVRGHLPLYPALLSEDFSRAQASRQRF